MRIVISAIVFCFILSARAWAAHPFLVEDTIVQGSGNFLFELDADRTKKDEATTDKMTAVMAAGISASADLAVEVPYYELDPSAATGRKARGYGDVLLKLKQRTYENEVNQSFAYQFHAGMPTGDKEKGLGTNNFVFGLTLMDQQECRNNILRASVGYESFARNLQKWHFATNYAVTYGLALERKVTQSFRFLMEAAGGVQRTKAADRTAQPYTAMAGIKYYLFNSWYVDLAGRFGLNKDAEDNTLLVGATWTF